MDRELIRTAESANDGKSVYLYFNEEVGFYTAFGFSAFFVSHLVDPLISYSPAMELPVILIDKYQILELRRSLKKLEHIEHQYYRFELKRIIGQAGYAAWLERAKELVWTVR